MAKENPSWGYDRIVGALGNLGSCCPIKRWATFSVAMASLLLRRENRLSRWKDFIRSHMEVLVGTDFFAVEVLTLKGLVTYYVLFFIHLESRRVSLAGMTPYPGQEWMEQQARNATMDEWGILRGCRYLLHDRDTKFCASFRELIESGSIKTIRLPARAGWRRVARSVIATELGAEPRCFSPAPYHSPSAFFLLFLSSCSPFLELGLDQAPD
jgi:putative transposase